MDMSIYERLNRDDVQPLGYFPAGRGIFVPALIGGQPHLATVDTVPMKLEALERFVRGAPLRDVHECVAGVLALESEALDPRL